VNTTYELLLTGKEAGFHSAAPGDIPGPDPDLQKMKAAHLSRKQLRFLLEFYPFPAFITEARDQTILTVNANAARGFPGNHIAGKKLHGILCYRQKDGNLPEMAYFEKSWLVMEYHDFQWGETACQIVLLKPFPGLPGPAEAQSARDMAALVLHRLRSPLTGMQGYIDLLAVSPESDVIRKRVAKLASGMDQLNAMLDELESLHTQEWDYKPTNIRVASVILDVIKEMNVDADNRIQFRKEKENRVIRGNREKLEKLLKILVQNALEHPSGKNFPVVITAESPLRISITNFGDPVPEYIRTRMFYPFVTDKAQHMGLGLTLAMQIARQLGITIIPVRNSAEEGITFSLLLPPN